MMAERRPLVEGLKTPPDSSRSLEKQFVYGKKVNEPAAAPELTAQRPTAVSNRVPFTSRVRAEIAQAVKRASLERQIAGIEPNTVQDILESALEPWLRANGYLS
jgi:hypothetical protein